MMPGVIVNEVRRQQAHAADAGRFETLSILEPNKFRQGSVTMIRRFGDDEKLRDADFEKDALFMTGRRLPAMPEL